MKWFAALLLSAIALVALNGHGVATRPILADDQLYYFMAERAASGRPPHTAQMEVKTQLPTLISAGAIATGRALGARDIPSARVASVAAALLSIWLVWLLTLELSGSRLAAFVGAFGVFAIHGVFVEAATGFQPKLFMIPFLLGAQLSLARRRHFATGFLAACGVLCWQPAIVVLASCGASMLLERRRSFAALLRLAAGVAVAVALYEAFFFFSGALAAQLHQEWVLAFRAGKEPKPRDWAESFWFVLTESQGYLTRPHVLPTLWFAALAMLWTGLLLRPRRFVAALLDEPAKVAFWAAAQATVAFTLYDHQAHPDMLLPQPYFAVGVGLAFGWIASRLWRARPGPAIAGVLAAAFVAWSLYEANADVRRSAGGRNGLDRQYAMADMTTLYRDHFGSVWALGPLQLLALDHQDNWLPIGNVGYESREFDLKEWRPLKDGKMPQVILASRGLRPGAGGWLRDEYIDISTPPFVAERVHVFVRRSPGFDRGTAPKAAREAPPQRNGKPASKVPATPSANDGKKAAAATTPAPRSNGETAATALRDSEAAVAAKPVKQSKVAPQKPSGDAR